MSKNYCSDDVLIIFSIFITQAFVVLHGNFTVLYNTDNVAIAV